MRKAENYLWDRVEAASRKILREIDQFWTTSYGDKTWTYEKPRFVKKYDEYRLIEFLPHTPVSSI